VISRRGLDRAIARIIYELETIREEGYDRNGKPTWYALDRLEAISDTAQLAIDANELACVGGTPQGDIGVEPEYFDQYIDTAIGKEASSSRRPS
jgi:hypothetical protein